MGDESATKTSLSPNALLTFFKISLHFLGYDNSSVTFAKFLAYLPKILKSTNSQALKGSYITPNQSLFL